LKVVNYEAAAVLKHNWITIALLLRGVTEALEVSYWIKWAGFHYMHTHTNSPTTHREAWSCDFHFWHVFYISFLFSGVQQLRYEAIQLSCISRLSRSLLLCSNVKIFTQLVTTPLAAPWHLTHAGTLTRSWVWINYVLANLKALLFLKVWPQQLTNAAAAAAADVKLFILSNTYTCLLSRSSSSCDFFCSEITSRGVFASTSTSAVESPMLSSWDVEHIFSYSFQPIYTHLKQIIMKCWRYTTTTLTTQANPIYYVYAN